MTDTPERDPRTEDVEERLEAWARCPEHGPSCGGDYCCCTDRHTPKSTSFGQGAVMYRAAEAIRTLRSRLEEVEEERDHLRECEEHLAGLVDKHRRRADRLEEALEEIRGDYTHGTLAHEIASRALDSREDEGEVTVSFPDPSEMRGLSEDEAEAYRGIRERLVHADEPEGEEKMEDNLVSTWQCKCGLWNDGLTCGSCGRRKKQVYERLSTDEPVSREGDCDEIAPIKSSPHLRCIREEGHDGPHRTHFGSEWPADDSDLPTIMDLYGREPDATGDLSSEEFTKRLRGSGDPVHADARSEVEGRMERDAETLNGALEALDIAAMDGIDVNLTGREAKAVVEEIDAMRRRLSDAPSGEGEKNE